MKEAGITTPNNFTIQETTVDTLITYEYPPDGSKLSIIDPYDGCSIGCPYCFQQDDKDWNNTLQIKTNIVELIERDMPDWDRSEEIFLGSRGDPYMPIEGTYQLTRKCLEALRKLDITVFCVTKADSDLVFRDVDVMKEFGNSFTLVYGLSNVDQLMKSATSDTIRNIEIVNTVHGMGVKVLAFITPILPDITDVDAMIEAIDPEVPIYLDRLTLKKDSVPAMTMKSFIRDHYPELTGMYTEIIDHGIESYLEPLQEKYKGSDRVSFVFEKK